MGSEVVYLAGRGVSAATMTPYDVCALRLSDASVLAGTPPDDAERYLAALRDHAHRAIAATVEGDVAGADLPGLVGHVAGISWDEATAAARAAGALVGAYPSEEG